MKKLLLLPIILLALLFFSQDAKALIIISDGPNATELQDRYAGTILVHDDGYQKEYWYIDVDTKEKYPLRDGVAVSRLLKKLSIGISNANLNKIPVNADSTNIDYELTSNSRGKFLIQVEEHGEAWYVNPLDNYRYQIANGNQGFKTLKDLAIDIDQTKLTAFTEVSSLDFPKIDKEIDFSQYWYIQRILKNNYYQSDKVNDLDMFYGSLKGLADSLNDPYTEFFTPSGKKQFEEKIEGSLEGIGAYVDVIEGRFTIVSPLDNSPAEKAGLLTEDQILMVNDIDIAGFPLQDSIDLIKGPAGTDVVLKVYRPSTLKTFDITVTRAKIELATVTGKHLNNNIAYFRINTFALDLKSRFERVKSSVINDNTKGVIIDLRNNPGGYTSSAINLADYWIEPGNLIVRENFPSRAVTYSAIMEPSINLPTVILINEGTASASEIFTTALTEYDLAATVGQTTFGKGTGQNILSFEDGSALKYTVFEWFGPYDTFVEDAGIEPNYVVNNTDLIDKQLQKAENLLK